MGVLRAAGNPGCAAALCDSPANVRAMSGPDRISEDRKKDSSVPQQLTLNLSEASRLIGAGENKANDLGIPYNLAVVDVSTC